MQSKVEQDQLDPVTATIIRLAIDGLYYSELFQIAPLDDKLRDQIIQRLTLMTKQEAFILNPYVILAVAIVSEVFASSMLKVSNGFKKMLPTMGVIIGMGLAFYCLSLALKTIPLGTAYAIWSGVGTALTAVVGVIAYKERLNAKKLLGLALIIGGVIVLKLSSGI